MAIIISVGCATVSLDQEKTYSEAIAINPETEYGQLASQWQEIYQEQSGFFPLVEGMDALGARLDMADRAVSSIDLQYFLMSDDTAGLVISNALLRAADRGVRVRFLLDDVFTGATDASLLFLNMHPNIELRLFNPISRSGLYYLNFLGDFSQANRRMHNKSFTVDNAISIIGGRNIADEYFQLKEGSVFSDFDMLAFGPIATEISSSFDDFWNNELAIPIEQITRFAALEKYSYEQARAYFSDLSDATYADVYQDALDSHVIQGLLSGEEELFAANAEVLVDDPEKLQNEIGLEYMDLIVELGEVMNNATDEVMFLTPYYVPGESGIDFVQNLVDKGVKVTVITNSLAANNHVAVHAGYAGYRDDVINAGAELFEIRAYPGRLDTARDGIEQLTLHTKLVLIDKRYLFVGSLNLDPRSIEINAEVGVLLDSEELVGLMSAGIHESIADKAFQVVVNDDGRLEWHATINDVAVVETREPQTGSWLRFKAWALKIAPESQL